MSAMHDIEAILLVSGRPVRLRSLAEATGGSHDEVEAALSELESRYSSENSGIVLRRVGGGFQFATNPETSEAIERFRKEARPSPLSGAAHEVISCVLYLGPMTRSAVARVRGVNSDAVVRSLIERGLVAESGFDSDSPGTPALLDLTEEFHIASGTSTRADFPPIETLVSEAELDRVRDRIVAPGSDETPPTENIGDASPSLEPESGFEAPEPHTDELSGGAHPGEGGDLDPPHDPSPGGSTPHDAEPANAPPISGGKHPVESPHDTPSDVAPGDARPPFGGASS